MFMTPIHVPTFVKFGKVETSPPINTYCYFCSVHFSFFRAHACRKNLWINRHLKTLKALNQLRMSLLEGLVKILPTTLAPNSEILHHGSCFSLTTRMDLGISAPKIGSRMGNRLWEVRVLG